MTRLTIRLGPLDTPLAKWANARGLSLSDAARQLLAEGLGVEPPEMPQGTAALSPRKLREHQQHAGRSRRKD